MGRRKTATTSALWWVVSAGGAGIATAKAPPTPPPASLAQLTAFGGAVYDDAVKYNAGRIYAANETLLFEHTVCEGCDAALMTFFFMLAGKDWAGRFIADNTVFRYYVDGEASASLRFKPGEAAGTFVHLEGPEYYRTSYNATTAGPGARCDAGHPPDHGVTTQMWPYCGLDLADSDANDGTFQPWMTKWAGKSGPEGSWVNHVRVPFLQSIRVTAQLDWAAVQALGRLEPPPPGWASPTLSNATAVLMAQFRGVEGGERALAGTVRLGGAPLPPLKSWGVRLRMNRLDGHVAAPLEFVPIVDVSDASATGGAVFFTASNWRSPSGRLLQGGSIEGCWWSVSGLAPPNASNSILVGTGIEDYFGSAFAFGFFAKIFHSDVSGLSHVHNTVGRGCAECEGRGRPSWFSAYRYFDRDPLPFAGGSHRLVWRNGAEFAPVRGTNVKCTLAPRGASSHPSSTVVDSLALTYTWSEP